MGQIDDIQHRIAKLEKDHDLLVRIEVKVENLCANVKRLNNIIWGFCSVILLTVLGAMLKLVIT